MKRVAIATIVISMMVGLAQRAAAHAFLEKSDPKVGSSVSKPPTEVRIAFSQVIEPAFSAIQVFGTDGKEIDRKDCRVDPKDRKAMVVSLSDMGPGKYRVAWHVVSLDTHRTQGEFKFIVK